ncbi:hypothetical protein MNBD_GAMMA24-1731 [hydrothermal vent metagenome]|uniref:YfdX protein n=1 Tax=hydrothermal vent metagenome TaxID=652676 RepID=A0A3B1BED2_9ZZZZ
MYSSTKISAALLLLLTGIIVVANNSMATTSAALTDTRQTQIQQASVFEKDGRKAMSYIVAANQLLSKQHSEEAHHYLDKARELLLKLKAKVSADKTNVAGLLSIYSQLGIKKEIGLTDKLRQKLEHTHLDVIRGKHKKVINALKAIGVELKYSFVDLPVAATLAKVESALKSLSGKNIQKAREILADAEAGLIHKHFIINAPTKNPARHTPTAKHTEHRQGVF